VDINPSNKSGYGEFMPAVWLKEVKKNHPCDTFSSAVRKPREPTVTSNEPKEVRKIRLTPFRS